MLDQFVERGFRLVREEPPHLLVAAAAGQPWRIGGGETIALADADAFGAFDRPGYVRIALSFELAADGAGATRLATETRVTATDPAAARVFGR